MAEEVRLDLVAKVDEALKEIESLKKSIDKSGEATKDAAKETGRLAKGFKGVGLAIKAAGIGLVLGALSKLKEIMEQNQTVMDLMSTATTALGIVFNQIVDAAVKVGESIFSAFNNPQEAVSGLWDTIKENIINRFEGFILQFKALGKVIEGVFSLDWDQVKEGAGDYATALVQVVTGLDEVQQTNFVETIKDTATALVKSTQEAVKTSSSLVALRNEVQLLEAGQQALMLTYQNQAELQRQIRDDESATIEERIAANDELGRILEEQLAKETELAQKKVDLAQIELDQNKDNIDLQDALIRAQGELVDINERITGQRSEQLTNQNALLKEQTEIENELSLIGLTNRELEMQELTQWYQEKLRLAQKSGQDTLNIEKEFARRKGLIAEDEKNAKIAAAGAVVGALGQLAGDNKAFAVAGATIDTYAAIAGQLKAFSGVPVPGYAIAQAVATGLVGLSNVRKILQTEVPNGGGGSAPSGVSSVGGNIAASIPAATGLGDVVDSINGQANQPVEAFVIAQNVTDSQEAQSYINNQRTL